MDHHKMTLADLDYEIFVWKQVANETKGNGYPFEQMRGTALGKRDEALAWKARKLWRSRDDSHSP